MSRVQRFSLVLAALLLLTIAPKFLFGGAVLRPDEAGLAAELAGRLRARGYVIQPNAVRNAQLIRAAQGACKLVAVNMDPEGHLVTWFAERAARTGPIRYHSSQGDSRDFPRFWPPIETFVQRSAFALGINTPRVPVIAVAAAPACQRHPVDWSGLQLWGTRQLPA